MKLTKLNNLLNELLNISSIKDASLNGLQIEGSQEVKNIAFSVDISGKIIEKAVKDNIDCIIVHHGLFWGKEYRIKGILKKWIKKLLVNDISLIAIHLPLDLDLKLGNNRYIYDYLDLLNMEPIMDYKGFHMGIIGKTKKEKKINKIEDEIRNKFGEIKEKIINKKLINKIGILTGDPKSLIDQILDSDIDLLISGELTHQIYYKLRESGKSGLFLGHYKSEIGGLKYLKSYLKSNYKNDFDIFKYYKDDSGL